MEMLPVVFSAKTLGVHTITPFPRSCDLWAAGGVTGVFKHLHVSTLIIPCLVSHSRGPGNMASPVFILILLLKLKSPVTLLFHAHLLVSFSQSAKHFQMETRGRNYLAL